MAGCCSDRRSPEGESKMIITPTHPDAVYFKATDVFGSELMMDYYDTETREADVLLMADKNTPIYIQDTEDNGKITAFRVRVKLPPSIKVTCDRK